MYELMIGFGAEYCSLAMEVPEVHLGTAMVGWQVTVLSQNQNGCHVEFREIACSQHQTLNMWGDEG